MPRIPHAHTVNIIKDPPRELLHVGTSLPEFPDQPGFSAEKKQHLLQAVARKVSDLGLDGYQIHWSVNPSTPR